MNPATEFDELRWAHKAQKKVFRHEAALSLVPPETTSLLDVGCGDGLLLKLVSEKYPRMRLAGAEVSASGLERARTTVASAVFTAIEDPSAPLPFPDGAFEVVVALDVLEHVFMPETLLQELKRVASKGVIIGVPNFSSLPARLQTLIGRVPENNRPSKGHVYWFNHHVLIRLLRDNGLQLRALRMNYPWQRVPVLGAVARAFCALFPNVGALSYVAYAEK